MLKAGFLTTKCSKDALMRRLTEVHEMLQVKADEGMEQDKDDLDQVYGDLTAELIDKRVLGHKDKVRCSSLY